MQVRLDFSVGDGLGAPLALRRYVKHTDAEKVNVNSALEGN